MATSLCNQLSCRSAQDEVWVFSTENLAPLVNSLTLVNFHTSFVRLFQ